MLNWANQFNIFCFLDNHEYEASTFDCILAAGVLNIVSLEEDAFDKLKDAHEANPGWLFGHLGYDLKNESFPSSHIKPDRIGFGKAHFFEPAFIITLKNEQAEILSYSQSCQDVFNSISKFDAEDDSLFKTPSIKPGISKADYLKTVEKLRDHIKRGDCYEINFCQEFYAEQTELNPVKTFQKLSALSPNPFAALYKLEDKYCICESPERYLKKAGNNIISQPIKGTVTRNSDDNYADLKNKHLLQNSVKERAENVMIVDLVRNDLSKVCVEGSVEVQELFGIYSFPQLFQMISTIKGILPANTSFTEVIKATFPMGSMTGAPKHKVLQLIEKYEQANRGLFSGSIGYITPDADFDFNVVIRSIFYNKSKACVSFWAGSAITFYSNAEDEYKECLLKAEAIIKVLES